MQHPLILASTSAIRLSLLQNAGLVVTAVPSRVDEETLKQTLVSDAVSPRDQSDILAEAKARKVAQKYDQSLVIGCDQVLDFHGQVLSKPNNLDDAKHQLRLLRGQAHTLFSAVVIYENQRPAWRHIARVNLEMHDFSESYLNAYLSRNADHVVHACGAYQLEGEGVRLFDRIEGDYFSVLGLPLVPLLTWLRQRGFILA